MKKNQNEPQHDGLSHDQSDYKSYGDYYILDPAQDIDMQFPDDDDDELSYFPLTDFSGDQDFEE
jgi:hypothetical protein